MSHAGSKAAERCEFLLTLHGGLAFGKPQLQGCDHPAIHQHNEGYAQNNHCTERQFYEALERIKGPLRFLEERAKPLALSLHQLIGEGEDGSGVLTEFFGGLFKSLFGEDKARPLLESG